MIPKLLHFVWISGRPVPDWAERNLSEFARLNPDHEIHVHNATSLHPAYADAYAACAEVVQKADLVRYSVLEREGGWYFDLDFWPFRPVADAERAWELDGSRLVIARQHGQKSLHLELANAPLACAPGLPIWEDARAEILKPRVGPPNRTAYGPELMMHLARKRPDAVRVMDWPWWFPSAIPEARADLAAILGGDRNWARSMCAETTGQLPFAMHLWANGATDLPIPTKTDRALIFADPNGPELMALAKPCDLWPAGHALAAARDGLAAAGFDVQCILPGALGDGARYGRRGGRTALAVVWNGRRAPAAGAIQRLRAQGVPVYQLEHGFWDRRRFIQCDPAGFLHFSSWASDWGHVPPADADERLRAFWPQIAPMQPRKSGYILVIGQVSGDTQLDGSEIPGPVPLERHISLALPKGLSARFRPHPLTKGFDDRLVQQGRTRMARLGGTLKDALAGARFVVTINSNSLVEAAALGCPALAFGPSTALMAGVARQATVPTLAKDLEAMVKGWVPPQDKVDRYLRWLACRQYHVDEMRQADFWRARIGGAA